MLATASQLDASAQAPCTSTIVGLAAVLVVRLARLCADAIPAGASVPAIASEARTATVRLRGTEVIRVRKHVLAFRLRCTGWTGRCSGLTYLRKSARAAVGSAPGPPWPGSGATAGSSGGRSEVGAPQLVGGHAAGVAGQVLHDDRRDQLVSWVPQDGHRERVREVGVDPVDDSE